LLYAVANAEPVMQRDASRLLLLFVFYQGNADAVRQAYRELVLASTECAELARLARTVRDELDRVNPVLGRLIAEQEPLRPGESRSAELATQLSGTPFINDGNKMNPSALIRRAGRLGRGEQPRGCMLMLLLSGAVAAGLSMRWLAPPTCWNQMLHEAACQLVFSHSRLLRDFFW
jgi:hypothetical protein